MLRPIALALLCFGASAAEASPISVSIATSDWSRIDVDVVTNPTAIHLETIDLGGRSFARLNLSEGLNLDDIGLPDLPTLYRLVAVDPSLYYTVELTVADNYIIPNVTLAPIQRDLPDRVVPVRFQINEELYRTDTEIGNESVMALNQATLAGVAVLPLKITPLHYNPAQKRLTVWTKIHATIRGEAKNGMSSRHPPTLTSVTPFQRSQIANLVANQGSLLKLASKAGSARLLIVTPEDFLADAARVAYAVQKPGFKTELYIVKAGISPPELRAALQRVYQQGGLDSVLLLGDEAHLPPYSWGNGAIGDSYFSFLDGDDYYADIGIGRLPAASASEVRLFGAKLEAYTRQNASGPNKSVLLVAHSEGYPNDYTANQESVRTSANPRGLKFVTQYAGLGATNASVGQALNAGPALVAYRGHGSNTDWHSWAADSQSFGPAQLQALSPADDKLSVYLEIACENGALQLAQRSFAEAALLTGTLEHPGSGAVGVLAATFFSLSAANAIYNQRLFEYMQTEENLSLGNINALAANRIIRDNGGSIPANVKMYILFAHPLTTLPF